MRRQFDGDLQRGAGIESGAVAARKIYAAQRVRLRQGAVATEKLLAITGRARDSFIRRGKSYSSGKLVVEGIVREDCGVRLIDLGYDIGRRSSALQAKHQLVIQGDC